MDASRLNPDQRRTLDAVVEVLRRLRPPEHDLRVPRYPQSVPDLAGHLDDLATAAERLGPAGRADDAACEAAVCGRCPHQYPHLACTPKLAGCVPHRLAPELIRAVAAVAPPPGAEAK